ncbi:MAG: hypothetical protein ABSH22_22675 [Tepidisphaeraceae bacterium]
MENTVLVVVLVLLGALAFSYLPMAISGMRKRRRGVTRRPNAAGATDWSWASGADTGRGHSHHAAGSHHQHASHHVDAGAAHHGGGFSGGHGGGGFGGGHH